MSKMRMSMRMSQVSWAALPHKKNEIKAPTPRNYTLKNIILDTDGRSRAKSKLSITNFVDEDNKLLVCWHAVRDFINKLFNLFCLRCL